MSKTSDDSLLAAGACIIGFNYSPCSVFDWRFIKLPNTPSVLSGVTAFVYISVTWGRGRYSDNAGGGLGGLGVLRLQSVVGRKANADRREWGRR